MSETKGEFKNAVILLDEPGHHLHASAQKDLLKRMKEYAKDNQLIYSTHLPFMIESTELENIYICEEKPNEGVKVHQDWGTAEADARFTLQAALGITWSQSLFVGTHNLVVEGITDFWYLNTLSEMLRQAGREGLDEDVVITPAGGASKVAYVGTILKGQELNVAVLLDSDPEGQNAMEQLVHQWILDQKQVLLIGSIIEEEGNRCIEDMFSEDYYIEFVKEAYKKELKGKKFNIGKKDKRTVVQRIEDAMNKLGIEHYNKGRAGKRIMNDLATKTLDSIDTDTAARFEKVIHAINKLVAQWKADEDRKRWGEVMDNRVSMSTSFSGRLRNTKLPKTMGMMTLYEAVVNSIHAI